MRSCLVTAAFCRADEKATIEFVGWGGLYAQEEVVEAVESDDVQEGDDSSRATPQDEGEEEDTTAEEEAQESQESLE